MKKFLALVLALVMTMSLVTISAGAEDFTDAADINYEEAVEVISALGVVGGYADGSFNPEGGLTRQAAAKIICNMILGPTTAAELNADTNPYPDVDKDSQFAGYIAYCQKEGIISGYADGTFKGANGLTGYAFAKMLLGALGYDADVEGYTGANWSINVAKQFIGSGLNAGLKTEFNGSDYVTREEAALYAFNTLKATMVDYESKATVNVNGASVVVAGSTAEEVEWIGYNNADGNVKNDNLVQFAEKYFAKLKGVADLDAFGRPTTKWTYNKKDVGSYVDYTLKVEEYTTSVKGGEVYSDIGSTAAKYDFVYFVDGVQDKDVKVASDLNIEKKSDTNVPGTARGALTEVFVDDDAEVVYVVVINTYLGYMISDYNEKTELSKVAVYTGVNEKVTDETIVTKTVKLENVANVADFEDDDMVLVTMADGVVMSLVAPEVVEEVEISSFSTNVDTDVDTGTAVESVVAGGEKYNAAVKAFYDCTVLDNYADVLLADNTFNLFLDTYGNVIGIELVDAAETYLFVVGYENNSSVLSQAVDKASVIFTDGTQAVVDIKLHKDFQQCYLADADDATVNAWFKYSMDGDVYVLEAVADQVVVDKAAINSENTTLDYGKVVKFGNSKSAYIVVDTDKIDGTVVIDEVQTVVTGIKNADLKKLDKDAVVNHLDGRTEANVFALFNTSGYVTYAVVIAEDASSTDNLAYITSTNVVDKTYVDKTTGYVYTYKAIVDGEETTVQVKADEARGIKANTLYVMTYDVNGYAKDADDVKGINSNVMNTTYFKEHGKAALYEKTYVLTVDGATLWIRDTNGEGSYVIIDEECVFWVKNTDKADGGNNAWTKYDDADAAVSELGVTAKVDAGYIAVIADKDTGYATSIIIYDTDYDVVADTEEEVVETGAKVTYAIDVANNKLNITVAGSIADIAAVMNSMTNEVIGDMLAADGYTNIKCANGLWSFDKGYESFTGLDVDHILSVG